MDKETVIQSIVNAYGNSAIAAIYQVGIDDASVLSDIDVVIVTKEPASLKKINTVDIRGIFMVKEFTSLRELLPYENFTLLFGEDVSYTESLNSENRKLIKLACMQFTGFLRNFYTLKKSNDTGYILSQLNDFAYVRRWLPEWQSPEHERSWDKIENARNRYPHISHEEVQALLTQAMSESWELIDILAKKIEPLRLSTQKKTFWGKHPTIFVGSTEEARTKTEQLPFLYKRARIIYLPLPFSFITTKDTNNAGLFIQKYIEMNLKPKKSIKYTLQRWAAQMLAQKI